MRLGLLATDVVQVVGGDERDAHLRAEPQQLLVQPALLGHAVVLQLEEEVAVAEDVAIAAGDAPRLVLFAGLQGARHFAVQARRQPDEPLGVLGQVLAIDARLVVVAVEMGVGDDPAQVLVAGPVLRQQDQVVRLRVSLALAIGHRAACDVRLDADDRLDLGLLARLVEGDRAVQRAVVGQAERVEAERLGLVDHLGDAAQAVEQAELGMDMEVREVVRRDAQDVPVLGLDRSYRQYT